MALVANCILTLTPRGNMPAPRSSQKLMDLFRKKTVVDLPAIQQALGDVSVQTAFRYLKLVPYRRSYDHNGRYYALYEASRFDRAGLWSVKGIHFSVDGSLKNTVRRLVYESVAGATHRELQLQLQLRVQNTLLELWRKAEIRRELMAGFYVYLHTEDTVRKGQFAKRQEQLAVQQAQAEITDVIVIEVLLTLIRHPDTRFAGVVRRLQGHSPPITAEHVRIILDRYHLESIGQKGGHSRR
ncbi:MAG: hypothetical protein GY845_37520 [Planctomycetes bacterium]|nr:hypothetical protein [Planctomycetota bacterium]